MSFPLKFLHLRAIFRPIRNITICFSSNSSSSVSRETVELLERLSLVKFSNEEGIRRLESAIRFADQLREVDTANVEPLYSVQENRSLHLRPDAVTETDHCEDLLNCAARTLDDCFLAPPGNVPLARESGKRVVDPSSPEKTESRIR